MARRGDIASAIRKFRSTFEAGAQIEHGVRWLHAIKPGRSGTGRRDSNPSTCYTVFVTAFGPKTAVGHATISHCVRQQRCAETRAGPRGPALCALRSSLSSLCVVALRFSSRYSTASDRRSRRRLTGSIEIERCSRPRSRLLRPGRRRCCTTRKGFRAFFSACKSEPRTIEDLSRLFLPHDDGRAVAVAVGIVIGRGRVPSDGVGHAVDADAGRLRRRDARLLHRAATHGIRRAVSGDAVVPHSRHAWPG